MFDSSSMVYTWRIIFVCFPSYHCTFLAHIFWRFFSVEHGSIVTTEAICLTNQVDIASYSQKKFVAPFVDAIKGSIDLLKKKFKIFLIVSKTKLEFDTCDFFHFAKLESKSTLPKPCIWHLLMKI